jgi:hypothetical protein
MHHSKLFDRQRGSRFESSSSITEKMTSMQDNRLVETIEKHSKEVRLMHNTVNSLTINLVSLCKQNHELKASRQRMEKNLL